MTQNDKQPKFPLTLDIQFFSEEPPAGTDDDPIDDPNTDDPSEHTGGEPDDKKDPEGKTYTQEDIDRIVRERLAREKKKREEALDAERKKSERDRLVEKEEYKGLYESLQNELGEQKAKALETKKEALLTKAGYTDDQVARYAKYLEGETDDELQAKLDDLKADIPPKKTYADPNPGNGGKQVPKKKSLEDKGKSTYQRLKAKGKIRG